MYRIKNNWQKLAKIGKNWQKLAKTLIQQTNSMKGLMVNLSMVHHKFFISKSDIRNLKFNDKS